MRSSHSLPGPIRTKRLRNDADVLLEARIKRDRIRRQRVQADREFDVAMLRAEGHPEVADSLEKFFMENEVTRYRNYTIEQHYTDVWVYQHDDYCCPEDDIRNGTAPTLEQAKADIDELEDDWLPERAKRNRIINTVVGRAQ